MRDLFVLLMIGIPALVGYFKGSKRGYASGYDDGYSAAKKAGN